VYRWADQGRGNPERIEIARNRISELQQMPANRIAFAAEDPGFGVIGPDGKVASYRGPDIIDFSKAHGQLHVSPDASVVGYLQGGVRRTFSTVADAEQAMAPSTKTAALAPQLSADGFRLTDWKDSYKPVINGTPAKFDDYEMSRSYAFAADGESVLLGTEWAVRLLDRDAKQIWGVALPAVAWAVNIAQNGRLAVAALSDGTIRWYRMADGKEVLAFFPHGNGSDWISWTPDGYYTSSVHGDNYIGWHVNRGKDLTPDFYRAVQFDRILYRPDIVRESFVLAQEAGAHTTAPLAAADLGIASLPKIAPPRLRVRAEEINGLEGNRPRAVLRIDGEKNALDMRDYVVYVNSVPVTPNQARKLSGGDSQRFSKTIEVSLPATENEIRVEAFNGVSMGVAETYIGLPSGVKPVQPTGDLYVLAIGINAFPSLPAGMHLAYAARDAEKVAQALAIRAPGFYRQVHTRVLSDRVRDKPARDAILSALQYVQQAQAEDTVVIFLASHGLSDKAGNYYLVPRDVTRKDIVGVRKGEKVDSLVPWTAFFEALRGAAGRRILIVDTCHAKRIRGPVDAHSLMKRSAASHFPIIVAAQSKEQSQEYPPAKQGLFTFSLLTALKSRPDSNGDGSVSLKELFDAVAPLVQTLSEKSVGPQNPQLVAPLELRDMALLRAVAR
jgi:hypothetical protein